MSGILLTNHKIIRTKHGQYITIFTEDFDMINLNIDKNIESYDKNFNFTKNIYRNIKNFKKKFNKIHDEQSLLLARIDKY
jgi:hypothetical protein